MPFKYIYNGWLYFLVTALKQPGKNGERDDLTGERDK
jgi:hypothetical protein